MIIITFELFKGKDGWRIRVRHRNRNILFVSSEAYKRKFDANRMLSRFVLAIQNVDFERVEKLK